MQGLPSTQSNGSFQGQGVAPVSPPMTPAATGTGIGRTPTSGQVARRPSRQVRDVPDIVEGLCFQRLRAFVFALEEDLQRLLAAPSGARLRMPIVGPRYKQLLEATCYRFRVCSEEERTDGRQDIVITTVPGESQAPLPAAALLPTTWGGLEPSTWNSSVPIPVAGESYEEEPADISASPALQAFGLGGQGWSKDEATELNDEEIDFAMDQLKKQEVSRLTPGHWLMPDHWTWRRGSRGGAVLTINVSHASVAGAQGLCVAMCADEEATRAVLDRLLVASWTKTPQVYDSDDEDQVEDPYVVLLDWKTTERQWLLSFGRSWEVGSRRPEAQRWASSFCPTNSTFWVGTFCAPDGSTLMQVGLGKFPQRKIFETVVHRATPRYSRFALASLAAPDSRSVVVCDVRMDTSVCEDLASRDHIVVLKPYPTKAVPSSPPPPVGQAGVVACLPRANGNCLAVCQDSTSALALCEQYSQQGWTSASFAKTPLHTAGATTSGSVLTAQDGAMLRSWAEELWRVGPPNLIELGLPQEPANIPTAQEVANAQTALGLPTTSTMRLNAHSPEFIPGQYAATSPSGSPCRGRMGSADVPEFIPGAQSYGANNYYSEETTSGGAFFTSPEFGNITAYSPHMGSNHGQQQHPQQQQQQQAHQHPPSAPSRPPTGVISLRTDVPEFVPNGMSTGNVVGQVPSQQMYTSEECGGGGGVGSASISSGHQGLGYPQQGAVQVGSATDLSSIQRLSLPVSGQSTNQNPPPHMPSGPGMPSPQSMGTQPMQQPQPPSLPIGGHQPSQQQQQQSVVGSPVHATRSSTAKLDAAGLRTSPPASPVHVRDPKAMTMGSPVNSGNPPSLRPHPMPTNGMPVQPGLAPMPQGMMGATMPQMQGQLQAGTLPPQTQQQQQQQQHQQQQNPQQQQQHQYQQGRVQPNQPPEQQLHLGQMMGGAGQQMSMPSAPKIPNMNQQPQQQQQPQQMQTGMLSGMPPQQSPQHQQQQHHQQQHPNQNNQNGQPQHQQYNQQQQHMQPHQQQMSQQHMPNQQQMPLQHQQQHQMQQPQHQQMHQSQMPQHMQTGQMPHQMQQQQQQPIIMSNQQHMQKMPPPMQMHQQQQHQQGQQMNSGQMHQGGPCQMSQQQNMQQSMMQQQQHQLQQQQQQQQHQQQHQQLPQQQNQHQQHQHMQQMYPMGQMQQQNQQQPQSQHQQQQQDGVGTMPQQQQHQQQPP